MTGKFESTPKPKTKNTNKKLPIIGAAISLALLSCISCANTQDIQSGVNQDLDQSNDVKMVENLQQPGSYKPGLNKVSFQSEGEKMVGNLYLPDSYKPGEKLPVVVVAGSWTTVKEQMADLYAKRLTEQGIPTLTFDFRYFGESGGQPRQYESPNAKIQDIKNAVAYLRSLPIVDENRIGGLAVCASAGYMAHAIAQGAPLKSFVTVAAWLHDPQTVVSAYQNEAGVRRRVEAANAAQNRYEQTGKVEYIPAASSTDRNAAMFGSDYYARPDRGAIPQWKNQFAVMSWSEWLQFDGIAAAPKVKIPTLFVHSDRSAFPKNVQRFYNAMPGAKDLFWTQGFHSDFYDKEPYVTKAAQATVAHFQDTLLDTNVSQR